MDRQSFTRKCKTEIYPKDADLILVTHGRSYLLNSAIDLAKESNNKDVKIICNEEIG